MMKFLPKLALSAAALLFTVAVAGAQTAPQAAAPKAAEPAKPAAAAPVKSGQKKPTTPEGIECSNQADAKGLKGKERKKFRDKCKRDLLKAKAAPKGAEPAKKS